MKKQTWVERLVTALGGGDEGKRRAAGASKHGRGKQKPRGWYTTKRQEHRRQKMARRAQRGKRGN